MKKTLFIGLAIVLSFGACETQEQRYTQQSSEISTFKKVIDAYEQQDWTAMISHYADTAKIINNVTKDKAQTIAQLVATHKGDASKFSSWEYDPKSVEYEMVVTDNGETWVNFWGDWQASLLVNNKKYVIPSHITARFIDGKIVQENGYWDVSELMMDLKSETEKVAISDE